MWPVSCSSSFWLSNTQNGINISLVVDTALLNKVLYTYLILGISLSEVGMICSSSSRLYLLVACLYERHHVVAPTKIKRKLPSSIRDPRGSFELLTHAPCIHALAHRFPQTMWLCASCNCASHAPWAVFIIL